MLLMLLVASSAAAVEGSRYKEAIRSRGGVISTESPAASEAGLEVLDAGGSAMDAAVTMTFALGVARPQSCGIGGGGFLVYRSADGETAALDFRETAPSAVSPDTFAEQGLHKTFTGHTTVGVPGTVAGIRPRLNATGLRAWPTPSCPPSGSPARGSRCPSPFRRRWAITPRA
jgi:gamma-glutamyltranspeptidase / glutathione hydrolase